MGLVLEQPTNKPFLEARNKSQSKNRQSFLPTPATRGEDKTESRYRAEMPWLTTDSTKAPGPVWHSLANNVTCITYMRHTQAPYGCCSDGIKPKILMEGKQAYKPDVNSELVSKPLWPLCKGGVEAQSPVLDTM